MARIPEKPVRKSLRAAINAKCRECIYDPHDRGTWREQVERCTGYSCPLFDVRPSRSPGRCSSSRTSLRHTTLRPNTTLLVGMRVGKCWGRP